MQTILQSAIQLTAPLFSVLPPIGFLLFDVCQNRGYSPVRGNVCTADKRVPVFGEKAGE